MTKVAFEEKYYPAVKEMVYRTRLANGLTVALLPKKEFKEVYGSVTVQFGSVDTLVTGVDRGVKQYPARRHDSEKFGTIHFGIRLSLPF